MSIIWQESVVLWSVWLIYKISGRSHFLRRIIFSHNSVLPTASLLSQQCAANCLSPVTTLWCQLPLSCHNSVLPTASLLSQHCAANSPVTTVSWQLPLSCHNSVLPTASLLSQQCAANCLSPVTTVCCQLPLSWSLQNLSSSNHCLSCNFYFPTFGAKVRSLNTFALDSFVSWYEVFKHKLFKWPQPA